MIMLFLVAGICCPSIEAQTNWEAAGFELAWQFRAPTQMARMGRLDVVPYVSGKKKRAVYEVGYEGGPTTVFTSGQVARGGVILDDAAAARLADIQLRTLKALGHNTATITTREVPHVWLLVQTGSGQLLLLDGETGQLDWSISVGKYNLTSQPPALGEHHVVAIKGSRLYIIDLETGKLEHEHMTRSIPDAGPTVAGFTVLVPTMRGPFEVYSLRADEIHQPPRLRASYGRTTSSPVGTAQSIAWATDRGFLFLADPVDAIPRSRIVARQGIVGAPAFVPPDRMVMSVEDGYVLAVELQRQQIEWEYFTGESITEPPYALNDVVYVPTEQNGLFALDSQSGSLKWQTRGIARVVNGLGNQLFCESPAGQLVTVDTASGRIRNSVDLALGDQLLTNKLTDRIYVVRHNGLIECVRAAGARWPTVHLPLPEVPDEVEVAPGDERPPTSAEPEPSPGTESDEPDNPFAEVAEDQPMDDEPNPFAADGETEDVSEDDPFATDEDDDPFATGDDEDPFATGDDEDPFGF